MEVVQRLHKDCSVAAISFSGGANLNVLLT